MAGTRRRPAARVSRASQEDTSVRLLEQERLLVEAAQKNPAKFAELYELNFERVYAFIVRRVGDRDTAEDLTSDVFHKALANLKGFEWRGTPFAAWLCRIALNAIVDRAKRMSREVPQLDDPPDPGAEPDLTATEHHAQLFRLVDQLPREQRRVIFDRFVEQKSIREIAEQLGKTEGAIKQLQFRALEKLRTQMEGAHA
jgi:RNA polymerase sigma-70 factor, ECF subfamily